MGLHWKDIPLFLLHTVRILHILFVLPLFFTAYVTMPCRHLPAITIRSAMHLLPSVLFLLHSWSCLVPMETTWTCCGFLGLLLHYHTPSVYLQLFPAFLPSLFTLGYLPCSSTCYYHLPCLPAKPTTFYSAWEVVGGWTGCYALSSFRCTASLMRASQRCERATVVTLLCMYLLVLRCSFVRSAFSLVISPGLYHLFYCGQGRITCRACILPACSFALRSGSWLKIPVHDGLVVYHYRYTTPHMQLPVTLLFVVILQCGYIPVTTEPWNFGATLEPVR